MATKVFHYPNCSTCRKALKWLDAHGVAYEAVDIVAAPPTKVELQRALKAGLPIAGTPPVTAPAEFEPRLC